MIHVMSSPRSAFAKGLRAGSPLWLGVAPFGLLYGTLANNAGLSPWAAQSMSVIIFAGSAQFITTQLLAQATPYWVIVLTVFVVNLRHALYSASLAPHLKHLSGLWKWLMAYLLTDETYAMTINHYQRDDSAHKHWFYLGVASGLWLVWNISTAIGIGIGARAPSGWSLDFILPLTFIALVVPALKDRASVVAALVAGLLGIAALGLPYKLGLMLATLIGIGAGLLFERRRP